MDESWTIRPFDPRQAEAWDLLVQASNMGNMLHSRRFLDRNGLSAMDCSLTVYLGESLHAVIPLQRSSTDVHLAISHPRATFGGLIHWPTISGSRLRDVLSLLALELARQGFRNLEYRAVPLHVQSRFFQEDLFHLSALGAYPSRTQVNSVVDLARPGPLASRKQRNLKKASSLSIEDVSAQSLPEFHSALVNSLRQRHSVTPAHSADDLQLLLDLFPGQISILAARRSREIVAGTVIFGYPDCDHAQYIFSSEVGRTMGASDFVLARAIRAARIKGRRYFSFGTSNDPDTGELNEGLHRSKQEFGAGSIAHMTYLLPVK